MALCTNCQSNRIDPTGVCLKCGATLQALPAQPDAALDTEAQGAAPGLVSTIRRTHTVAGSDIFAPPAPPLGAPRARVLNITELPPEKRLCPKCRKRIPKRLKGFCNDDGTGYNFQVELSAGDRVGGQYIIEGLIDFGGFGGIYLAWDDVVDRWVVLKAVLNARDDQSVVAALREGQTMGRLKHPNVVNVYNLVHVGMTVYIVMEDIPGKTMKQLIEESGGKLAPQDAERILYSILPAFEFFESAGATYNDLKPANIKFDGTIWRIVDRGSMWLPGQKSGQIIGTQGFSAPELDKSLDGQLPTPLSDQYNFGRVLAAAWLGREGFFDAIDGDGNYKYLYTLPSPAERPEMLEHPSLCKFLQRCTSRFPQNRFANFSAVRQQLFGVMREHLARANPGVPITGESELFVRDSRYGEFVSDALPSYRHLPSLRIDPADPAAGIVAAALASPSLENKRQQLERAIQVEPDSVEAPLRAAALAIDAGDDEAAASLVSEAEKRALRTGVPRWRAAWYQLLLHLSLHAGAAQKPAWYQLQYDLALGGRSAQWILEERIIDFIPGETAPKQARALIAELLGQYENAIDDYNLVSLVEGDRNVAAVYGLARAYAATGQTNRAIRAYDRIPRSSSSYLEARTAMFHLLLSSASPSQEEIKFAEQTLVEITNSKTGVSVGQPLKQELRVKLLEVVRDGLPDLRGVSGLTVLNCPMDYIKVRKALAREYLEWARHCADYRRRCALIDKAELVLPRTLF